MNIIHQCCCGLDVHKKSIVGCLLKLQDGKLIKETRSFKTVTPDLLRLADWLSQQECTHIAMESTGVYWKPVYNLLENQFTEVMVVNAQHLKTVPGRKTDVKDAEWIAQLLQHGLLKASFIPPTPQRELRELTRYRSTLVRERTRVIQRLQKVLEEANIKLASVASDIMGVSAKAMLAAIIEGETKANILADLAKGKLRDKRAQLEEALAGRVKPHHRFLLAEHLSHIDYLDEAITRVSTEIVIRLHPFQAELERLDTIPGVNQRVAQVILAEIGTDMSRFPSARHLAAWAGMCPGNHESAGKHKNVKARQGSQWLRQVLVEAANAAARTKNTYLAAQYRRIASRRGKQKALVAVGHTIVRIVYYLLTRQESYQDLGSNYFDERERKGVERRLVNRLQSLGYKVSLELTTAA